MYPKLPEIIYPIIQLLFNIIILYYSIFFLIDFNYDKNTPKL